MCVCVCVCVCVCGVCICVCVCVYVCVWCVLCVCVQTHNEKRESKLVFMVLSARKRGTESKNDQIWESFQVSSRRHLLVFRTMNLISHASFYIIWAWRLTHECTLPWSLQMHFLVYTLKKSLEYATIKGVSTSNLRFYFYILKITAEYWKCNVEKEESDIECVCSTLERDERLEQLIRKAWRKKITLKAWMTEYY